METVEELLGPAKQQTVDDLLGEPRVDTSKLGQEPYDKYQLAVAQGATPEDFPITVPPSLNPNYDLARYMTTEDGKISPLAVLKPARETLGGVMKVAETGVRKVMDIPDIIRNKLSGASPDGFGAYGIHAYHPTFSEREAMSPDGNIIHFPRSTGTGAAAGLWNTGSDFLTQMFGTPEKVVLLGLMPTEGAAGGMVAGAYGTQAALEVPEQIKQAYQLTTHPGPDATVAQEMEALTSPVLQAVLAKEMLKHATTEGAQNARRITSPESLSQREIWSRMGQEAPLRQQGETAEARPQEEGLAEEAQVSLSPEHQALVDPHLERYNGVVVDAPETGRVMRANHETGQIEINKADFEKWVNEDLKDLSEKDRNKAIKSAFEHEDIHLKTDPADAEPFWNSLSPFEQYVVKRNYLKGQPEQSARNMGFEAIRNRVERAMGLTRNDFVGMALRERWTAKSLDALANIVSKIRNLRDAELSARQKAILQKVQDNLAAARNAIPSSLPVLTKNEQNEPWWISEQKRIAGNLGEGKLIRITELAAERKTALEISKEMGIDIADVRAARSYLKIPSMDQATDFEEWLKGYKSQEGPFMQRKTEEPEKGMTRLWRGHDGAKGGAYWSSDKTYAQRMGGQLESVDVPTDQLGDYSVRKVEGSGTPNAYKLPSEMTKGAEDVEGEVPVHDLGAAMMRRKTPEEVASMDDEEASKYFASSGAVQKDGVLAGMEMTPNEVEKLITLRNQTQQALMDALKRNDDKAVKASMGKNIWLSGAIEGALNKGPNFTRVMAERAKEGPAMMRKKRSGSEEMLPGMRYMSPSGVPGQEWGPSSEKPSAADVGAVATASPLKVFPEEIDWQEGSKSKPGDSEKESMPVRPITPSEARSAEYLKRFLTEDARKGGSEWPVSYTRRLTALFDRNNGTVHLVSTYPGDGTVRMVDPERSGVERPNAPVEELLHRYTPIASILLREPRQNFHQAFTDMADFQQRFGDQAAQMAREHGTGLAGIPGAGQALTGARSTETAEYSGMPEEQAEAEAVARRQEQKEAFEPAPTNDELRAVHDFFGENIPSDRTMFEARLLKSAANANRTMISALRKMARREMSANRGMNMRQALEKVLDQLYENIKNSETRSEFVQRTLAQMAKGHSTPAEAISTARLAAAERERKARSGARELTVEDFLGPKQPPTGTGAPMPEGVFIKPQEMMSEQARKELDERIRRENPPQFRASPQTTLGRQLVERQVPKQRYTVGGTKSLSDEFDIENPDPDQMELLAQEEEEAEAAKQNPELFPERQLMSEKPEAALSQPELVTKVPRRAKDRTKGESGMRQALEKAESSKRQEQLDLGRRADEPKSDYEFPQRRLVREVRELRDRLLSKEMESASLEEKNSVRNEMLRKIVEYENTYGEFPFNSDKGPAMMRKASQKVEDAASDVATAFLRGAYALKAIKERSGPVDAITASRDRADNEGNILGDQVQKKIELNTFGNKDRKQVAQIKAASNAVLSSGAFKPIYKLEGEARERYQELFQADPQYQALSNARSSEDPEMKANAGKAAAGIHKRVIDAMREEHSLPPPSDFKFQPQAKNKLDGFLAKAEKGIALAEQMIKEGNFIARNVGRKWKAAAEAMRNEVQYAKDHWGDEEMMGTALDMRKELEDQFQREKDAGYKIRYDDNYLPGRYQAEFFNDNSVVFPGLELLGRQFAKGKTFKTYYDAISNGPYIPATRDGAAIVGSRVRSGMRQINKLAWMESLKMIKDPSSPGTVATRPKKNSDGSFSPSSAAHQLVWPLEGRDPISVRKGYVSLIKNLSGYSDIKNFAPAWRALQLSQKLKHTMLAFDFFHLGKMKQFDWSLNAFGKGGHRNALSVLEYRPQDMERALQKGAISPAEYRWANEPVNIKLKNGNTVTMPRHQIADLLIRQGLNVGRIQDAIYKDMVANWPIIGRYNKFLFDQLTRGIMLNTAVHHFELYNKTHSAVGTSALARDVARDVNNRYASIGRQGWIKNQTYQDIFRTFGLAPQWWEGLLKTELTGYSRASGLSYAMGRKGLPYLGVAGKSMGRGLATLFLATQAINLMTRGHPTWENNEDGHKFDAWIPDMHGGDGYFISPLSVFNELTHDITRMYYTKPTVADAVAQIGYNKLGPMGRFLAVLGTGNTPQGTHTTTTVGRLKEAGKQLVPVPITLGRVAQYAGSKIAPGAVKQPSGTEIERQAASSLGVKMEPAPSAGLQMFHKTDQFLKDNGLKRDTGYDLTPTDEASYSKLRSALRDGDEVTAKALLKELRKTRTNDDIVKAMHLWATRPFTGSNEKEIMMIQQMSQPDLDLYSKAMIDREHLLTNFYDFMIKNDDGKD